MGAGMIGLAQPSPSLDMPRHSLAAAFLLALSTSGNGEVPKIVTALKGLDPVELAAGKEVVGKDDIAATRGRYRYRFATPENKAAFEKNPEAFAVQYGGSCARMGPLSGSCSTERFVVHDKRIYVFSSDSCRKGFLLAPELHIDRPDAAPTGNASETGRGAELVELALTGLGGAKAVDSVTSFRIEKTLAYPQKDKPPFLMKRVESFEFPGKFHEVDSYTGWAGANAATTEVGFQTSGKVAWPMDPTTRAYFIRRSYRDPLILLRSRGEKGFVAVAGGKTKIGTTDVEELLVSIHGATTTLFVEPKSGRILQVVYRGRNGGPIGEIARTYSDFRPTSGLVLPHGVRTTFDGKPATVPEVTIDTLTVNPELDPKLFHQPE
jgi:YHS domain-containing protein